MTIRRRSGSAPGSDSGASAEARDGAEVAEADAPAWKAVWEKQITKLKRFSVLGDAEENAGQAKDADAAGFAVRRRKRGPLLPERLVPGGVMRPHALIFFGSQEPRL